MITVAGATGSVGTALAKELIRLGTEVRVVTRDRAKAVTRFTGLYVDIAEIDFESPGSLRRAFADAGSAFISTGTSDRQVPDEIALITAAIDSAVPHLVNLSVGGAGGSIRNPVLEWHTKIEAFLHEQDVAATVLRPSTYTHTIVGLGAKFIPSGGWGGNAGTGRAAFIDTRDVADVAAKILLAGPNLHAGRVYDLTGPVAVTMHEVAELITSLAGVPAIYHDRTVEEQRAFLASVGLPPLTVEVLLGLDDLTRADIFAEPNRTVNDLTGHSPRSVPSWIQENASLFRPAHAEAQTDSFAPTGSPDEQDLDHRSISRPPVASVC